MVHIHYQHKVDSTGWQVRIGFTRLDDLHICNFLGGGTLFQRLQHFVLHIKSQHLTGLTDLRSHTEGEVATVSVHWMVAD